VIGANRPQYVLRSCHSTGGQSTVSHRGGPGSFPGQSMWDLWQTKWHWVRFFSESLRFPLSLSFHHCSIFTHVSSGGQTMGPLVAAVPQRHSNRKRAADTLHLTTKTGPVSETLRSFQSTRQWTESSNSVIVIAIQRSQNPVELI
jgi:hypothetical protein